MYTSRSLTNVSDEIIASIFHPEYEGSSPFQNIVTGRGVRETKMTGSNSDDWIY
jgi:hypothetical protein